MGASTSIVCPTFNRSALLRDCIHSIYSKPDASLEVIIADDGSTDDTPSVCRELRNEYGTERVVVSRTEQNLGAQAARNRGLQVASGQWVLFVDSDDVAEAGGLAKLVTALRADPSLDYAYGKVVPTDVKLKPLVTCSSVGAPFTESPVELAGYHWHTMGALYRKRYLEKVGPWNLALTGSQDWEYQARVKLAGGRGQFVDTVVGYWRHHDGSRIGAQAFRPDYVNSVMLACDSILKLAHQSGQCDRALERRLAKKLIIHALEWGANGHMEERQQCLLQAGRTTANDRFYEALTRCFQLSPRFLDFTLWKLFSNRNKRKSSV